MYPPAQAGSTTLTLNVDPSSLNLFKIGNSVIFEDGTTSIIAGVVINDNITMPPSSSQGFSNYSENFQEGIDLVSITLYLSQPTTSLTTSVKIVSKTPATNTTTTPVPNNTTPISDIDLTNISNEIEQKILNDLQSSETKIVDDIVNDLNAKFSPTISDYNDSQVGSSYNPVMREKTDNVFQSGNMSVSIPDQESNNRPGYLPSISESKTQIIFPNTESPSNQNYYYGADYVPSYAISETNRMLGRLDYVPPPLPPNFDFTYYGPFRSNATNDVKPANALQGPNINNNSDKILDNKSYQVTNQQTSYEKMPQPNMNQVSTYSSNQIDLYSQYGALVPKNNYYKN